MYQYYICEIYEKRGQKFETEKGEVSGMVWREDLKGKYCNYIIISKIDKTSKNIISLNNGANCQEHTEDVSITLHLCILFMN